jgi:phosphopantetheinyl transferase
VPVCDSGPARKRRGLVEAWGDDLPAPFSEAWRRPLADSGDVLLWCVPASSAGALIAASSVLDGADWAAVGRIGDIAARDHLRATRIALRLALSHAVSGTISPRSWRFASTSHGKPQVAPGLPHVHFCTSHTRSLSLIAVSRDAPVGVDVEATLAKVEDGLIASVCSPAERRALARVPEGERRRAFTELWTLKEAYTKLTGTGLATDLRSVAFQVETGRWRAEGYKEHRLGDVRLTSWLAQAADGPVHVSVAVDAGDPGEKGGELVCRTARGPAATGSA